MSYRACKLNVRFMARAYYVQPGILTANILGCTMKMGLDEAEEYPLIQDKDDCNTL